MTMAGGEVGAAVGGCDRDRSKDGDRTSDGDVGTAAGGIRTGPGDVGTGAAGKRTGASAGCADPICADPARFDPLWADAARAGAGTGCAGACDCGWGREADGRGGAGDAPPAAARSIGLVRPSSRAGAAVRQSDAGGSAALIRERSPLCTGTVSSSSSAGPAPAAARSRAARYRAAADRRTGFGSRGELPAAVAGSR